MNDSEAWAPIAGYEGLYEASDMGRVRSLDRTVPVGRGGNRRLLGRVLRPGFGPRGYGTVNLHKNGTRKTVAVHRVVAVTFMGPGDGLQVNHMNGDKADNRLVNLEWVTQSENTLHALDTGLFAVRGEGSPHAKLTVNDVREIRRLAGHIPKRQLSRRFGVSPRAIGFIVKGTTWSHVDSEGRSQ